MRRRRSRIDLLVVVALMLVGGLVALLTGGGSADDPIATTTTTTTTAEPERGGSRDGGQRERKRRTRSRDVREDWPLRPARGAGKAAGDPLQVAGRFAEAWINRSPEPGALREQRDDLVALSTGAWADEVAAEFKQSLQAGSAEGGSEGEVVVTKELRSERRTATILVVTRERLTHDGKPAEPYRYATYVARLGPARDGFAVQSWEPQ